MKWIIHEGKTMTDNSWKDYEIFASIQSIAITYVIGYIFLEKSELYFDLGGVGLND